MLPTLESVCKCYKSNLQTRKQLYGQKTPQEGKHAILQSSLQDRIPAQAIKRNIDENHERKKRLRPILSCSNNPIDLFNVNLDTQAYDASDYGHVIMNASLVFTKEDMFCRLGLHNAANGHLREAQVLAAEGKRHLIERIYSHVKQLTLLHPTRLEHADKYAIHIIQMPSTMIADINK
ncbi:hypothetical protein BDB00DRAFT_928980 [Zychaea mexicana]|uniref:uncharacterized protein n=1 Tax=Zychaea mexicana TaxID=64656 RepID=UPI0022FEFACF|nr:uncharacterized protein BDB00DRAFT_928980 [Zychaea mexicana]KAI9493465.1 hypothetical protein BDB00DRAFT_928980 [Zychaea mexicana]